MQPPDPTFAYVRISSVPGSPVWQVRLDSPAGRLLGTVSDGANGWQATVVIAGKLHTQAFPDRETAAAWLLSLAPRMRRR